VGVALAASAQAAPLMPQPLAPAVRFPPTRMPSRRHLGRRGPIASKPEEVRWGRGRHRGWAVVTGVGRRPSLGLAPAALGAGGAGIGGWHRPALAPAAIGGRRYW